MMVNEKDARAAAEELGLSWGSSIIDIGGVTAAYRARAAQTHPDRGGDAAEFVKVDRAKHVLLAWLAKPKVASVTQRKRPCDYCNGAGHVYQQGSRPGSQGLRRTCPKCSGSGDADIDLHNP